MAPLLDYPKTKKLSASGGFAPLTARPGALPKNVSTILQDYTIARIGLHLLLNRASPKLREKKVQMTPFQLAKMKKNRRFQG